MSSITNIWETGVNNGGNGTDNNQYYITDTSSSTKRLTIQRGTGKIGIGTNLPITIAEDDVKLDVNGSINLSGNIYKNGVLYVSNSTTWVENETKTKIYYTAGNVGINTNNPLELLDVNGTIKATNIIANGSGLTALNATNIATGTISTSILPNTIEVANFIGSGEYLNNLNASALNINSGKINNSVLPSTISVLSFQGDGSGLINLDASKISTGNINNNRLPANISVTTLAGSGSDITNLQAANISGNVPNSILPANIIVNSLTGIGSNITQLNASEIKTGKISSSAFLPDTINVQYLSGDGSGLSNIDAVKIAQGKLNNNLFNNDINISGTLSVGNLQVSGTSAIINTNTYQTENLEIINNNATGPSLIINHNSTFNDLLQISSNSSRIFTILKTGNVGIGGTAFPNSIYKLDVDGAINSSGNISSQKVLIRDTLEFYKDSTNSVLIKLPQTISNYTITLPNAGPAANNILKSDSSGNLSWVNINESPTLVNVYALFDNTDFEKTTNITLKNIKSSKLISAFNSTQFELFGDPQIIRIKDNLITLGNVSLTSINDPLGADVNTLNIVDTTLTDSTEPVATPSVPKQIPTDKYQYITLTYESAHPNYTSTTDGNQRTHTINFPENVVADILVVGGGGGGASTGGGGAGALIYMSGVQLNGTYTINVGRGGNGGISGNEDLDSGIPLNGKTTNIIKNSTILFQAVGGGGGGAWSTPDYIAASGGSGGGGAGGYTTDSIGGGLSTNNIINGINVSVSNSTYVNTGFTGDRGLNSVNDTGCFGNKGGNEYYNYEPLRIGAGGGGAGGVGQDVPKSTTLAKGGDGGAGKIYDITGISKSYAGGGGGGMADDPTLDNSVPSKQAGLGGSGIGGNGKLGDNTTGFPGSPGTGSGGGGGPGGASAVGGNGGSGIVIIRYQLQNTEMSSIITCENDIYTYVDKNKDTNILNFNNNNQIKLFLCNPIITFNNFTIKYDNLITNRDINGRFLIYEIISGIYECKPSYSCDINLSITFKDNIGNNITTNVDNGVSYLYEIKSPDSDLVKTKLCSDNPKYTYVNNSTTNPVALKIYANVFIINKLYRSLNYTYTFTYTTRQINNFVNPTSLERFTAGLSNTGYGKVSNEISIEDIKGEVHNVANQPITTANEKIKLYKNQLKTNENYFVISKDCDNFASRPKECTYITNMKNIRNDYINAFSPSNINSLFTTDIIPQPTKKYINNDIVKLNSVFNIGNINDYITEEQNSNISLRVPTFTPGAHSIYFQINANK